MIRINEIFYSIQGETLRTGFTSVFVRLTGCNLSCDFCDTARAMDEGVDMPVHEVVEKVLSMKPFDHVTITGGEPLIQAGTVDLLNRLHEERLNVQVETNGSIPFTGIPESIRIITDIKTPSSGESDSFNKKNIDLLDEKDEIKFVISNMDDYEFARNYMKDYLAHVKSTINFSPAHDNMKLHDLAKLIIRDKLNVRLNVQLHKLGNFE